MSAPFVGQRPAPHRSASIPPPPRHPVHAFVLYLTPSGTCVPAPPRARNAAEARAAEEAAAREAAEKELAELRAQTRRLRREPGT